MCVTKAHQAKFAEELNFTERYKISIAKNSKNYWGMFEQRNAIRDVTFYLSIFFQSVT